MSAFSRGVNETFAVLGCYAARLVVSYRRFGTTYRVPFLLQPSRCVVVLTKISFSQNTTIYSI